MEHMPTSSQSFHVTVPTRAAAEAMADALAARGHLLVAIREVDHFRNDPSSYWYGKPSLRPEEQGQWDVFSIATGPLPDDDVRWWEAQEARAVRRLAVDLHGRVTGNGEGGTETLVRVFTRVGLVHELSEKTVRRRRADAFAGASKRAGTREERRVDDALPDGPGEPVALNGVDAIDWSELQHAYGSASDVPQMLLGLAANDDGWNDLQDELIGSVLHQGSTYSASAPALALLAELAASPHLAAGRRLDILRTIFFAGSGQARADARAYRPDPHQSEVSATVVRATERLLPLWPSLRTAEQRMLLLLAVLSHQPVPEHDFQDPASRLATVMIRDPDKAEEALHDLASRNEDLIELTEGHVPLHSRLVTALDVLLC